MNRNSVSLCSSVFFVFFFFPEKKGGYLSSLFAGDEILTGAIYANVFLTMDLSSNCA